MGEQKLKDLPTRMELVKSQESSKDRPSRMELTKRNKSSKDRPSKDLPSRVESTKGKETFKVRPSRMKLMKGKESLMDLPSRMESMQDKDTSKENTVLTETELQNLSNPPPSPASEDSSALQNISDRSVHNYSDDYLDLTIGSDMDFF